MTLVTLDGVEELTANQTSEEEGVDGQRDDLQGDGGCKLLVVCVWETQSSDWVSVMTGDDQRHDSMSYSYTRYKHVMDVRQETQRERDRPVCKPAGCRPSRIRRESHTES